jgi:hypothetical protein
MARMYVCVCVCVCVCTKNRLDESFVYMGKTRRWNVICDVHEHDRLFI